MCAQLHKRAPHTLFLVIFGWESTLNVKTLLLLNNPLHKVNTRSLGIVHWVGRCIITLNVCIGIRRGRSVYGQLVTVGGPGVTYYDVSTPLGLEYYATL